jgi:hypothetical protein
MGKESKRNILITGGAGFHTDTALAKINALLFQK